MITTVDVETSWQKTETGGYDPSPFHPDNVLVSVGLHSITVMSIILQDIQRELVKVVKLEYKRY